MKKILPLLLLLLTVFVSAAECVEIKDNAFETEFSVTVEKPLENKIYPLLRATNKKTVLGVVLRQYPDQKQQLFNTVRLLDDGKFFVLEFRHAFLPGKTYQVKLIYLPEKAEIYLDGKLMKSRPYSGKFVPGKLHNISKSPVKAEIKQINSGNVKSAVEKTVPAIQKSAASWRVQGRGLTVKNLPGGKIRLDYDGKGHKAVLWSTLKKKISSAGEHIRASGKITILSREYGSMFRLRINNQAQTPVLTMSGDRFQHPMMQTKENGKPDRFDFSFRGVPNTQYAFNIEFYGNPQSVILEDFSITNQKIVRGGRPPEQPENRSYNREKVMASLNRMKPVSFELKRKAGRISLFLDGKEMSPVIYRRGPHYPQWTRYAAFRDAGINLCYFFAMLGAPSETHKMGVAGIWQGKGKYDFAKLDEELRVIHAINPRARVIIALSMGTYEGWDKDYPEAVFTNARGEKAYALTTGKHLHYGADAFKQKKQRFNEEFGPAPSYYSEEFKSTSAEAVAAVVEHLEKTPEGKIVCGIHLVGGADGQFFPLDRDVTRGEDHSPAAKRAWSKYLRRIYNNDVTSLRKAWNNPAVTFENPGVPGNQERGNDNSGVQPTVRGRDYVLFTSAMMRDLRLAVFKAVKQKSAGRLMTGAYCPPGTSGNFHFDDLLASEDVDFLLDIQRVTPAGSFLLHKKLYIGEVDMRVPHVMTPIGNYVFDQPSFENVVRQTVSNIVQREGGFYHLFDIGEAYYYKKETTQFFEKVRKEHDAALSDFTIAPVVGVFMDYQQLAGCSYRAADHLFRLTKYSFRHILEHSGVPFQVYSVKDIFNPALKMPKIIYFPLLPEFSGEEIARLRTLARKNGSAIIWGHWRPFTAQPGKDFAGYKLSIPRKNPLSSLKAAHPDAGIRKGAVLGESYTVSDLGGNFFTWYERPFRVETRNTDKVLGVYADDGKAGFIERRVNGVLEFINGAPGAFSPEFFRKLSYRLGQEVLSDNNDVIVLAENGMLTCVCERGGKITVNIPRDRKVVSSLGGIDYRVENGKLHFTAANDFEVQSFKLK